MHKVEKEILQKNLSYRDTIKLLDKAWNSSQTKSEKEELIKIYCDISGSKPSELLNYLSPKNYDYKYIDGKKFRVFNPPTVSEQLEHFDKRQENYKKDIGTIIKQRNKNYDTKQLFLDKIDINTATVADLLKLKGIGQSKAEKIINNREKEGLFENIDDIANIPGVGKTVAKYLEQFIEF